MTFAQVISAPPAAAPIATTGKRGATRPIGHIGTARSVTIRFFSLPTSGPPAGMALLSRLGSCHAPFSAPVGRTPAPSAKERAELRGRQPLNAFRKGERGTQKPATGPTASLVRAGAGVSRCSCHHTGTPFPAGGIKADHRERRWWHSNPSNRESASLRAARGIGSFHRGGIDDDGSEAQNRG